MVQCPVTGLCWFLCPSLSIPHHLVSALCIFRDRVGSQCYMHFHDTSFQDITLFLFVVSTYITSDKLCRP